MHQSYAVWTSPGGPFPKPPAQFQSSLCRAFRRPESLLAPAAMPHEVPTKTSAYRCATLAGESSPSCAGAKIRSDLRSSGCDMPSPNSSCPESPPASKTFPTPLALSPARFRFATPQCPAGPQEASVRRIRNLVWNHAHHDCICSALPEDIHAESPNPVDRIRKVRRAVLIQLLDRNVVPAHQLVRDKLRILVRQHLQAFELQFHELSADFHLRRPPR